jgi:hypothetical protein
MLYLCYEKKILQGMHYVVYQCVYINICMYLFVFMYLSKATINLK